MSSVIDSIERSQLRRVPAFQSGDRVRVHFQVVEGTRRRTQVFEGTVIKRQGTGVRETFTVRKQSFGVGVERTFPVHSPKIDQIEVASRGEVRRAKLYYLRDRVGRSARVRERRYTGEQEMEGVMPPEGQEDQIEEVAPPTPEPEQAEGEAGEAPEQREDAGDAPAEQEAPAAEAEPEPDAGSDGDAGGEPAQQDEESPGESAS